MSLLLKSHYGRRMYRLLKNKKFSFWKKNHGHHGVPTSPCWTSGFGESNWQIWDKTLLQPSRSFETTVERFAGNLDPDVLWEAGSDIFVRRPKRVPEKAKQWKIREEHESESCVCKNANTFLFHVMMHITWGMYMPWEIALLKVTFIMKDPVDIRYRYISRQYPYGFLSDSLGLTKSVSWAPESKNSSRAAVWRPWHPVEYTLLRQSIACSRFAGDDSELSAGAAALKIAAGSGCRGAAPSPGRRSDLDWGADGPHVLAVPLHRTRPAETSRDQPETSRTDQPDQWPAMPWVSLAVTVSQGVVVKVATDRLLLYEPYMDSDWGRFTGKQHLAHRGEILRYGPNVGFE